MSIFMRVKRLLSLNAFNSVYRLTWFQKVPYPVFLVPFWSLLCFNSMTFVQLSRKKHFHLKLALAFFFFFNHTSSVLTFRKYFISKFYNGRLIWHFESFWMRVQCKGMGLQSRNLNQNRKSTEIPFTSWLTAEAA